MNTSTLSTTAAATVAGRDANGNPISADTATIDRYDRAIDRLLRFDPEAVDLATELAGEDSPAPMAHALIAYLHLMSTDAADLGTARDAHEALVASNGNAREEAHAAAIGAWLAGDWTGAARRLDDLLIHWPADTLALMLGHQLDFFLGDAQSLRDRPIRSLRELGHDHPHAPFVRGMAAFGLEESGHYEHALDTGLAAVEANADDVWAIHAVVHTYEMQGRVDAGIGFLRSDRTQWESGNLFTVHNWWHLALYELEAGRPERALAIYDAEIHHDASLGVPIEMLDASALLWRMLLDGTDTGARFGPLADSWAPKAATSPWYVFNDLHATMALVGADRLAEAHGVVSDTGPLARHRVRHECADDGRDRSAGMPRRARLRRAARQRRDRRVAPDPARAAALRWIACTTRRAAADAARVGAALGTLRARQGAHRRAARRAREQRLRLVAARPRAARAGRRRGR